MMKSDLPEEGSEELGGGEGKKRGALHVLCFASQLLGEVYLFILYATNFIVSRDSGWLPMA